MDKAAVESLAMDLHKWYLEATAQLSPEDFNKKAQISYSALSEGQKHIDHYIATAILEKLGAEIERKEVKDGVSFPYDLIKRGDDWLDVYCRGWNDAVEKLFREVK